MAAALGAGASSFLAFCLLAFFFGLGALKFDLFNAGAALLVVRNGGNSSLALLAMNIRVIA